MEIWRPILGYEGLYSASNTGSIRSEDRIVRHHKGGPKRLTGALLKPFITKFGYEVISLAKSGINTKRHVHRLVLSAFTGVDKEGYDACHRDSVRTNNQIDNLRWDTRKGNMSDALKLGRTNRGVKNPNAKLTPEDIKKIRLDNRVQRLIAKDFNVDPSTISDVKRGEHWKHVT